MTTLSPTSEDTLYEQVADRVVGLIDAGTLRVGQRIPSVRKMSQQLKVSISTVLQAYRLLEDRGRIEARPQSGYYVKAAAWRPPAAPEPSRPSSSPTHVNIGELAMRMCQVTADGTRVPLGGAIPGPHCLPTAQLNRIAASIGRRAKRGANTYDMPPGCRELRVQVARRALESGCALSPDDIVTTCGGQEALYLCLRAVTEPGDAVAIETPTYYGVLQIIQMLGLKAVEIPTCPGDGVEVDALRDVLDECRQSPGPCRVKACLLTPNFNNPLGSRMPDESKRKVVDLLAEQDIALIEDDIFGDLGFGPQRPKVCKAYDESDNVLLCSSFSKTLAPGFRVGWCAPGKYRDRVMLIKATTTLATPTLFQMTIAEYLATGGYDHHLRRLRKINAEQVTQVTQAIQKYFPEGTRTTRPQGGSVLWVQLPGGPDNVDAMRLHDLAYAAGISIAPGPIFSATGKFTDFIRLNCGWAFDESIDRAIMKLGEIVRDEASTTCR